MLETLKLLSPFIPFLTEALYQDFFRRYEKAISIHLTEWPKVEKKFINDELENKMRIVKRIVEVSNSIRHSNGIKLRYPLNCLYISGNKDVKGAVEELENIIKKMANVKKVEFCELKEGKEFENGRVLLDMKVTDELKKEWLVRELVRNVQDRRKKIGLKIKDKIILHLKRMEVFEIYKNYIESSTSSKIEFGKIKGNVFDFKFEDKKYEFGIELS
jgi:isoleucyl-tRNA synthetase